jgi:hypothetical protein
VSLRARERRYNQCPGQGESGQAARDRIAPESRPGDDHAGAWDLVGRDRAPVANRRLDLPGLRDLFGATQVAIYNIAGSNGQTIAIGVPNVTFVNQGNAAKTLTLVPDAQQTVQLTNSGNPGTNIPIGGAITIDSTTANGVYSGTFNVTADYQ